MKKLLKLFITMVSLYAGSVCANDHYTGRISLVQASSFGGIAIEVNGNVCWTGPWVDSSGDALALVAAGAAALGNTVTMTCDDSSVAVILSSNN